jgi:putative ABC transport system permease protein
VTRGLGRDLRIAARRLLATPLFTTFAVLSLAVGIGVTTIAYSVVSAFFFKSSGIRDPRQVALVMVPGPSRLQFNGVISVPDFDDLRGAQTSFRTIAASRRLNLSFTGPAKTELLAAEAVSGDYFQTLGVDAVVGRTIQPADDDQPASVAVISHQLWRARFASDAAVIGQTVRIAGRSFAIVGVAPQSYTGLLRSADRNGTGIWVPMRTAAWFEPAVQWFAASAKPGAAPAPERERPRLAVVGRLHTGRNIEGAAAEIAGIAAALDSSHPRTIPERGTSVVRNRAWTARTTDDVYVEMTEAGSRLGLVVAGLVMLVLVVACTNLANLMLARGITRRQEFAVRRALGGTRWRLIRGQLAESVVIAAAGGLAAYIVMRVLAAALAIEMPLAGGQRLSIQPAVDTSTLVMAVAALLVSLIVFGLEPAIQLTRATDLRGELAEGTGSGGVPKAKRQKMLLRWQVAISTAFFILASMTVRFTFQEFGYDSGVRMEGLGIAQLNFYTQGWDEARARRALDRVLEEARRNRQVDSIAVSTGMPFGTHSPGVRLSTPDKPFNPKQKYPDGTLVAATPGIFRTIGVPILRGRAFDDRDHAGAAPVVVVSEFTARALFGTADAVDRQLLLQVSLRGPERPAKTATIVGVARDTDTSYLRRRQDVVVYAPLAQQFDPFITVVAHSGAGSAAAVGALQTAIRNADPDVAIEFSGSGDAVLRGAYAFLGQASTASLSLGLLTLGLAMVGLYGVQSHGVAHRTREIGVRMSFGATAAQIKRMVLKDGYRPVFEGMAIGIFIGLAGRGVIRAYLEAKTSVLDPWMIGVVPIPLILAAFCACYLPARRASKVEPIVALRTL